MTSGDIHAEQSVYSIESRRCQIYHALVGLLSKEVLIIDAAPDEDWKRMADWIISFTLLRFEDEVRAGRTNYKEKDIFLAARSLPDIFNGNWGVGKVIIYCHQTYAG